MDILQRDWLVFIKVTLLNEVLSRVCVWNLKWAHLIYFLAAWSGVNRANIDLLTCKILLNNGFWLMGVWITLVIYCNIWCNGRFESLIVIWSVRKTWTQPSYRSSSNLDQTCWCIALVHNRLDWWVTCFGATMIIVIKMCKRRTLVPKLLLNRESLVWCSQVSRELVMLYLAKTPYVSSGRPDSLFAYSDLRVAFFIVLSAVDHILHAMIRRPFLISRRRYHTIIFLFFMLFCV